MAFLQYLMSALLFPKDLTDHGGDFQAYFISRRGWFFGMMAAFFSLDLVDTLLKGVDHFASLGLEYPVSLTLIIAGSIAGIITRNTWFHRVFASAMFIYQLIFAFRYTYAMQG